MKTKVIGKFFILGLILSTFYSCKEEEFLEKDYIDTLKDQYERENLPDLGEEAEPEPGTPTTPPGGGGETTPPEGGGETTPPGGGGETTPPGGGGETTPPGGGGETTPPGPVIEQVNDAFTQKSTGEKVDILWVVDNSGSMGNEQKALGDNFDAFIKEFADKGIDFQMAVTTTDVVGDNAGAVHKNSILKLTDEKLNEDRTTFMDDFRDVINVGTRGSPYEKGLEASEAFTNKAGDSWLREDAYYAIVYVSDEKDQSKKSVEEYLDGLIQVKKKKSLLKAYSIVNMARDSYYQRYKQIAESTGGEVASITSNFYSTLLNIGSQIANLASQFPLSRTPNDVNAITVTVDGIEVQDWDYLADSNSIKFHENHLPANNASIKVSYGSEK